MPAAFLAAAASLAIAFSINRRRLQRPTHPAAVRAACLGAAALMLASLRIPRASVRWVPGLLTSEAGLLIGVTLAAVAVGTAGACLAGLRADSDDRLLAGATLACAAFSLLAIATFPSVGPVWNYAAAILAGATVARADGNFRRP